MVSLYRGRRVFAVEHFTTIFQAFKCLESWDMLQVVVVVLADWTVVCLDHNLQTLWYTQIRVSFSVCRAELMSGRPCNVKRQDRRSGADLVTACTFPRSRFGNRMHLPQEEAGGPYGWATMHAKVREVGILISNHTMRQGDRGVVIVGGSVELGTPPPFLSPHPIPALQSAKLRLQVRPLIMHKHLGHPLLTEL